MDEEFGVGDLVSESFQEEKRHVGASIVCMYACTRCKCCMRVRGASVVCMYEVQVLYACTRCKCCMRVRGASVVCMYEACGSLVLPVLPGILLA